MRSRPGIERIVAFQALLAFCFVASAEAGGPLAVTQDGRPVAWSTSSPVSFTPDQGPLGLLTNAQAVQLTQELFKVWEDVPTASIAFRQAGQLSIDVTGSNFFSFFNTLDPSTNAIVFDSDGSATDAVFGTGARRSVIGFAGPRRLDPNTGEIIQARAVLNGAFIDGLPNPTDLSDEEFKGVFIHEFGHFIGLDHSQINSDAAFDGDPSNDDQVPIMFPIAFGSTVTALHLDDAAWVSRIYPDASFASSRGMITGRVFSMDGDSQFQGANVIARRVGDARRMAVSCVSGFLHAGSRRSQSGSLDPQLRGFYELPGLPPGDYTVEIEEINPRFTAGSGVGPLSPTATLAPSPPEFYNGGRESNNAEIDDPKDSTPVAVAAGAATSGINLFLNLPFPGRFAIERFGNQDRILNPARMDGKDGSINESTYFFARRIPLPAARPITINSIRIAVQNIADPPVNTSFPKVIVTRGLGPAQPDLSNPLRSIENVTGPINGTHEIDLSGLPPITDPALTDIFVLVQFAQGDGNNRVGLDGTPGAPGVLDAGLFVDESFVSFDGVEFKSLAKILLEDLPGAPGSPEAAFNLRIGATVTIPRDAPVPPNIPRLIVQDAVDNGNGKANLSLAVAMPDRDAQLLPLNFMGRNTTIQSVTVFQRKDGSLTRLGTFAGSRGQFPIAAIAGPIKDLAIPSSGEIDLVAAITDSRGATSLPSADLMVKPRAPTVLAVDTRVPDTIEVQGEVDYFRFSASAGEVIKIETFAAQLNPPSNLDTVAVLLTADLKLLAANDDITSGSQTDSLISFVAPASGDYLIRISGVNGFVGAPVNPLQFETGSYEVRVTRSSQSGFAFNYFPQIADGSNFSTTVVLAGSADREVAGTINCFKSDGSAFLALMSGQIGSSFRFRIPRNGALRLKSEAFAEALRSGWAQVIADGAVGGTIIFQSTSGNTIISEAGVGDASLMRSFTIFADSMGASDTGIAIANPGTQAARLTFTLRSRTGQPGPSVTRTLEPNAHTALFITQLFEGVPDIGEFEGTVDVTSDVDVVAVALRFDNPDFSAFTTLPVLSGAGATTVFFPQAANGGGFTTSFILISRAGNAGNITLRLFKQNGQPFVMALRTPSGTQTNSTFTIPIPANGAVRLQSTGEGMLESGYAVATADVAIGGTVIFQSLGQGKIIGEAGVAASSPLTGFVIFIDTVGSADTGIAVVNPGAGNVSFNATLFDRSGNQAANKTIPLVAGEHKAVFITSPDLFQGTPGIDEFEGIMVVSSTTGLVAIALRLDNPGFTVFTTLPVIPLR